MSAITPPSGSGQSRAGEGIFVKHRSPQSAYLLKVFPTCTMFFCLELGGPGYCVCTS